MGHRQPVSGGAVAAPGLCLRYALVLIPVGIYILETLSDIIQVGYFKLTHGRRFFRWPPAPPPGALRLE